MTRILVLNPNSNPEVTAAMDRALDKFRFADGPQIESQTLAAGPFGIETQAHVDHVATLVPQYFADHQDSFDAFVIACFSDPGLFGAREALDKPVFGIAQSGALTALSLGERIGVVSIGSGSIARHWRYWRALGLAGSVAGDLPINSSVADLANEDSTLGRMIEVGQQLKDEHGADVLLMGCAGMARYRQRMEDELQIPIVDPTQAAVGMAITKLCSA